MTAARVPRIGGAWSTGRSRHDLDPWRERLFRRDVRQHAASLHEGKPRTL